MLGERHRRSWDIQCNWWSQNEGINFRSHWICSLLSSIEYWRPAWQWGLEKWHGTFKPIIMWLAPKGVSFQGPCFSHSLFPEFSTYLPTQPISGCLIFCLWPCSHPWYLMPTYPQLHQGPCWFPDLLGNTLILSSWPLVSFPAVSLGPWHCHCLCPSPPWKIYTVKFHV